jgi:hypothetical protein
MRSEACMKPLKIEWEGEGEKAESRKYSRRVDESEEYGRSERELKSPAGGGGGGRGKK